MIAPDKTQVVGSLVTCGSVSGLARTPKPKLEPTGYVYLSGLNVCIDGDANRLRIKIINVKAVDGRPIQRQPERVDRIGTDQIGVTKSKRLGKIIVAGKVQVQQG